MKTISMTESKVTEALAQIDALEGINPKDRGCLRLLTEEMFSMAAELLDTNFMDFSLKNDKGQYSLCISTKTRVDETARDHFLSMSSSGKNTANKGVKGLLGSVLELLSYDGDFSQYGGSIPYGLYAPGRDVTCMWMLSQYMEYAPLEKVRTEWDGMEKSIIANFADDVAIGVRSGRLEMTVTKTFK